MFQDSVPAGSYNDPFLSSVCVWSICTDVKLLSGTLVHFFVMVHDFLVLFHAGGQCTTDRHCPTKTLSVRGDTEPDQLCVPASIYHFSEWQPAKPSTGMSFRFFFFIMDKVASEPSSEQGRRKHTWNFVSNGF